MTINSNDTRCPAIATNLPVCLSIVTSEDRSLSVGRVLKQAIDALDQLAGGMQMDETDFHVIRGNLKTLHSYVGK